MRVAGAPLTNNGAWFVLVCGGVGAAIAAVQCAVATPVVKLAAQTPEQAALAAAKASADKKK